MIAICNSDRSKESHGQSVPQYAITPGKRYLVLGISFVAEAIPDKYRVLYQVLNDFDGVSHVPAGLFIIQNGQCSSYWVVRNDEDGSILIWPEEFFVEYFHDDLSEGRRSAIELLQQVVRKLTDEAGFSSPDSPPGVGRDEAKRHPIERQ